MNTHIYSQQAQQSPAMAHDMHKHRSPISQHSYAHPLPQSHPHSHSHSHSSSSSNTHSHSQQPNAQQQPHQLPAMSLPPPHGYPEYSQHPQQSQHPQHSHSQHSQHSQQHSQPPRPSPYSQHAQHPQHAHAQHPQHPQHPQHQQHQQSQPPRQFPPPPSPSPQQQSADLNRSPTSPNQDPPKPTFEQEAATKKALEPVIGTEGNRSYRLDVVQQPKRARMCGFGDKDRRPITPPPCVRIVVTDITTGKEVDCNEIEHTMFVLNVDLWSEDALKEVNLVRHTTTTPSISSTAPASYEQVENTPYLPNPRESGYNGMYGHHGVNHYGPSSYAPAPSYTQTNGYGPPNHYGGYHGSDYGSAYPSQPPSYGPPRVFGGPGDMMSHRLVQGAQPQGMFTRNLIGSLAASAFRLQDPADKIGIWFVLQDLSVRTEGNFRLRFSFVNVGPLNGQPGLGGGQSVNTGKAPVLASCFSDVFTVYSAKKFPGVCESTVLSKTFATQGIKIPIRKEGAGKRGDDDDDYE